MVEKQHRKTIRELYEEAYGKKRNKKFERECDGIYICDDEEDDDDVDCFCD